MTTLESVLWSVKFDLDTGKITRAEAVRLIREFAPTITELGAEDLLDNGIRSGGSSR